MIRRWIRRWIADVAIFLALAALAGAVVTLSGVISIRASGGHWAITQAFLELAKRRSVDTHSLGADVAPEEPWHALLGAGHYETVCTGCHGAPGRAIPAIGRAMTPPAPALEQVAQKYDRAELFAIVKHGIKLTAMPAWPAEGRDDEVRALVAFLETLPGMEATAYQALVFGEELADSDGSLAARRCARCHGADGKGRDSAAFPKLAGQREGYLYASLVAYADGGRWSAIMEPFAAALTDAEMRIVARWYSGLEAEAACASSDATARGRAIAERGIPERGVPACTDCHGPTTAPRNATYPSLGGQFADYLVHQLELFQAGDRGGTPFGHLMDHVAPRLEPDEMREVASYYEALVPCDLARAPSVPPTARDARR
jgi:cytochrome c553